MVERTGASFPIGYGLKVPEDAEKIGAYWEERRGIIHATGFTFVGILAKRGKGEQDAAEQQRETFHNRFLFYEKVIQR